MVCHCGPGHPVYRHFENVHFENSVCGLGVGIIAYGVGVQPKLSSNDVSRSVTQTTLYSTIFVLTVHFVFAFFEFQRLE